MSGEMHSDQGLDRLLTFRVRVIAAFALGLVVIAPFLSNLGVTYSWSYLKLFALQTAVCIAWTGLLVVRPVRMGELLAASGVGLPMAAILAWCLLSTTWSGSRWAATQPLVELGYMGLAVVGFANLLSGARIRGWFTAAYGCAAGLACLVYIPGKLVADARRATDPKAHLAVYPFDNPNVAAAFAILPMTVGVSYVIAACAGRARAGAGVLGGVVAAACGAAIAASGSAAAMAGGAGAVVLVGVFSCRGKIRRYLLEGLAVLVVLVLLWPVIAPGLWPKAWLSGQLGARPAMWQGGLALAEKAPVTGLGLGSFPIEYSHVYPHEYAAHELWSSVVWKAHCLPLHIVAEVGIVGLVLAAVLILFVARKASIASHRAGRGERALLLGLVCGCLGMLAQGLVGMPLHYIEGYTNVVLALAIIGGMANSSWGRTPPDAKPSRLTRYAVPAFLLIYAVTAGPGLLSQVRLSEGVHVPIDDLRRAPERVEKLEGAVDACWPTPWTLTALDELANTTWVWGSFLEQEPERTEFAKKVFQAGLEKIETVNRLAPNFGKFKKKEAQIRWKLGQIDLAAEAIISYCQKDPFDRGAYNIWTDILRAAARRRRPQIARPDEAVRLLEIAEKFDAKRLPSSEARKLSQPFREILGRLPGRPR